MRTTTIRNYTIKKLNEKMKHYANEIADKKLHIEYQLTHSKVIPIMVAVHLTSFPEQFFLANKLPGA